MRIAVTGATGFIGRYLVRELVLQGHTVHLLLRSDFKIDEHCGDVQKTHIDLNAVPEDCFERIGCPEVLVHLAWGGLPNYRSIHHFEHELPTHFHFLEKIIDAGVKKIVAAGTCFEYGTVAGCVDEYQVANPTNAYGFAKDALRRQLEFLKLSSDFDLTWMRLFYLHGEGQPPGSLIPLLDAAIGRGDKVFPMTSGEQLRDYLPVDEAARIIARLAGNGRENGIVNVCSGVPISVRRLVEQRIRDKNSDIRVDLGAVPYSALEPHAFWGDRSKLNGILGI